MKKPFDKSEAVLLMYARQLRAVAKEVKRIISGVEPGLLASAQAIRSALEKYAEILKPWAEKTALKAANAIDMQDRRAWARQSKDMAVNLRHELGQADTGETLRRFLSDNVNLITSLPREAGERVHRLTVESLVDSTRAEELKKEIMRTGEVTENRAMLIARTEVARTATALTKVRSEAVGVTHFVWRTAEDADVRADHARLDGKVFSFDNPPVADRRTGERALPGAIYNCRCYAEPILTEAE